GVSFLCGGSNSVHPLQADGSTRAEHGTLSSHRLPGVCGAGRFLAIGAPAAEVRIGLRRAVCRERRPFVAFCRMVSGVVKRRVFCHDSLFSGEVLDALTPGFNMAVAP